MRDEIAYVPIGVADMRVVEEFWVKQLGLEVAARGEGPDTGLGELELPAGLKLQVIEQQEFVRVFGV